MTRLGRRRSMPIASIVRRYFWVGLGVGLLPLGAIATLAGGGPVGLAALAVAVYFILKGTGQLWLDHRLRRDGVPAQAAVVSVVQSDLRINFQFQWALTYRYTDHLGQAHEGRSGYLSPEEASVWKIGDTGTIRYDRHRPRESIWLGRA